MRKHPGRNVLRLVSRVLGRLDAFTAEPPPLIVPAGFYHNLHDVHDQLLELDRKEALGECASTPGVDGGCSVCALTTALQEAIFTWRPAPPSAP